MRSRQGRAGAAPASGLRIRLRHGDPLRRHLWPSLGRRDGMSFPRPPPHASMLHASRSGPSGRENATHVVVPRAVERGLLTKERLFVNPPLEALSKRTADPTTSAGLPKAATTWMFGFSEAEYIDHPRVSPQSAPVTTTSPRCVRSWRLIRRTLLRADCGRKSKSRRPCNARREGLVPDRLHGIVKRAGKRGLAQRPPLDGPTFHSPPDDPIRSRNPGHHRWACDARLRSDTRRATHMRRAVGEGARARASASLRFSDAWLAPSVSALSLSHSHAHPLAGTVVCAAFAWPHHTHTPPGSEKLCINSSPEMASRAQCHYGTRLGPVGQRTARLV